MEILVVIAIVYFASKAIKGGGKVVGSDYQREVTARQAAIAKAHPDWSVRRRNRIAGARALGATASDLLHLGPAVVRGMRQGWQEARDEWGSTREDHDAWRVRRQGELAARRAARDGARPSLWRRVKDRAWSAVLGPVPQVAFVTPPAPGLTPARNVVPFAAPHQPAPAPADPGPDAPGSTPAPDPGSPTPAHPGSTPAQSGPGSEPGVPTPAPADPGPDALGPGSRRDRTVSDPDYPYAAAFTAAQVEAGINPDNPTPAPAPAETGTDPAEPSAATDGGTDMVNLTGETTSYEATNAALDGFAEAAAETLSAAEGTALPITAQAAAAVAAAEQLSASLSSIGMKDETLNSDVRKLGGTAADLRAKADEMNSLRLQVMELAMQLDADARAAKEGHVQRQGGVQEAITAAGGTARDTAYFGN